MSRFIAAMGIVLFAAVESEATDIGQIQPLIAQLDDERFSVREKATNKLIITDYKIALDAIARTVEYGSTEARGRALHVLAMWHRSDERSRHAVKATAKRFQASQKRHVTRLGAELAARTTPKPIQQAVLTSEWVVGGEIALDSFITVESIDVAADVSEATDVISIIEE